MAALDHDEIKLVNTVHLNNIEHNKPEEKTVNGNHHKLILRERRSIWR